MATFKPKLKYRVVLGRNPKTGETVKRPQITERETYYLDQVVRFALDNGYVRGQFHDMRGALNGFIECIQYLGLNGKAVSLNDWLRVHAELSGTVNDDYTLSEDNELRVRIQALKELKADQDQFSWTNVTDTAAAPKVSTFMSVGGKTNKVIVAGAAFTANGTNLTFYPSLGDTAAMVWMDANGEEHSIELVPAESDYQHIKFNWTEDLDDIPMNSEVTLKLTLCGGVEGGAIHSVSPTAKLVAAS